MLPEDAIQSIAASMRELKADQAEIEKVHHSLTTALHHLSSGPFKGDGGITATSYGDTASATSLSFHHGLAHQVLDATLAALVKDLNQFAINLSKAAEAVLTSDSDSSTDIKQRQQLVDSLTYHQTHSGVDNAYNNARNHQHNPYSTTTSGTSGTTSGKGGNH